MGLVLTQEFFDNLQYNLIVPAIYNLEDLLNITAALPFYANISLMTIGGNLTSFHGRGVGIANDTHLFNLHDDYVTFNMTDLVLDFDLGYEFISDPAIIADLGFMNLTINDFDLLFNMTTTYDDYNLTLNVTYVTVDIKEFDLYFDGLNDFIYILNGFINRIFSIIANKIKPILEDKIEKVIPIINKILDYIPNEIRIPGTALHFDIGFAGGIISREYDYLQIPLSLSL